MPCPRPLLLPQDKSPGTGEKRRERSSELPAAHAGKGEEARRAAERPSAERERKQAPGLFGRAVEAAVKGKSGGKEERHRSSKRSRR